MGRERIEKEALQRIDPQRWLLAKRPPDSTNQFSD
jgi:hypothetical protein